MGLSETNRSSDVHVNHTKMSVKPWDFIRLASAQGQNPEKLQLLPEREFLLGGMPGSDRASTSGRIRAEDLASMLADEQITWCMRGGLAEALGPDGDSNAFAPVILGMLNNRQISDGVRKGIFMAMGTILATHYDEHMVKVIMQKALSGNWAANNAMGAILATHYDEHMVQEIMQKARNGDGAAQAAMGTILATHYDERMVQDIMKIACNSSIIFAKAAMGTILAANYNKSMVKAIMQMARNDKSGAKAAMGTILALHYDKRMVKEIMQMARDGDGGAIGAMGTILATHYDERMVQEIMQKARNGDGAAQAAMGTILAIHYDERMVQEIMQKARDRYSGAIGAMGTILATHHDERMVQEIMQMARNGNFDARYAIGEIIAIRSRTKINNDMSIRELRSIERLWMDAPATSSGEASSSRTRSPERRLMLDQIQRIPNENSQMEERERKMNQEMQRIQQEYSRAQEQLIKMQQERDQARIERDRIQRQLEASQQNLNQAQGERDRFQRQLGEAQQERDQAQRERTSAQEQLSQMRIQEEQRKQIWDRLYETMMNVQGQLGRQYERGQSSRGELRVEDALPTTVEGIEEQLEGEQRRQQESRERVQRLREHIQRIIWEQGDGPQNERLNQLLKYPMEGILKDQHLVEEIYPPDDQPAQDRLALRQSLNKALRHRLRNFYLTLVTEYTPSGLSANVISGEFVDQLQEQMRAHNRPNQEWIDASEDIQEEVTGSRPNRTPWRR